MLYVDSSDDGVDSVPSLDEDSYGVSGL